MEQGGCVGIDAGGTLIKLAYTAGETMILRRYVADDIHKAVEFVEGEFPGARLCITGGKSLLMKSLFAREARMLVEFEATCSGVRYLLARAGLLLESFVLTNVGTGTSIHHVTNEGHSRIGGTGVGGGTLLGLSALLTGIAEYSEIVSRSRQGSRETIDLKVSHIYEGAEPPISGDLTASNFGRVLRMGQELGHEGLVGKERFSATSTAAKVTTTKSDGLVDGVESAMESAMEGAMNGGIKGATASAMAGAMESTMRLTGAPTNAHVHVHSSDDLLASVVGLVGETVATTSVLAAGQCGASSVVYIGSSFVDNPLLAQIVSDYTRLRGSEPVMLQDGAFSGAIGALQALRELPPA